MLPYPNCQYGSTPMHLGNDHLSLTISVAIVTMDAHMSKEVSSLDCQVANVI
jgi:hypothetical protein